MGASKNGLPTMWLVYWKGDWRGLYRALFAILGTFSSGSFRLPLAAQGSV